MKISWRTHQIVMYVLGIVLFSFGAKFFIDSHLGVDPLDVLCIGMTKHLPISIGIASGMVAIGFLAVWSLWNRKFPPLTPFVTTFSVGCLIDFWNYLEIQNYTAQFLLPLPMLLTGLLLCAFASSLIIMSGIGIRIMDLVAITMVQRLGWSFFAAKMTLEVFLFSSGWLLGGPIGFGTVAFLFVVGPFIQPFMWANHRFFSLPNHGLKKATPPLYPEAI